KKSHAKGKTSGPWTRLSTAAWRPLIVFPVAWPLLVILALGGGALGAGHEGWGGPKIVDLVTYDHEYLTSQMLTKQVPRNRRIRHVPFPWGGPGPGPRVHQYPGSPPLLST